MRKRAIGRTGYSVAGIALALAVTLAAATGITAISGTFGAREASARPEPSGRVVPQSRSAINFSFAPVVKRAAPAVVNVYVTHRVREFVSPFIDDPFFRRFFGGELGVPRERVQNSLGSGVIVSPEGVIVTNYHVIKGRGAAEIRVVLADRREFDARVVLTDEKTDLAVLRIKGRGRQTFPYLVLRDSDELEVGDLVLAIGNPFGVGQTVTSGIISALSRTQVGRSRAQVFLQTDAAINPGNSGGALVDMSGRLVGINTMIFTRSGGSIGIGFAIPSNLVRLIVDAALSGEGRIARPWFGATLEPVTRDIAEALGLDRVIGALVVRVYPGSPAARAGLRRGDVIVAVDGRQVLDPRAFHYRFTTGALGSKARIRVVRDGRARTLTVLRERAPGAGRRDARDLFGAHPLSGARVANLSPALAEELGLDLVSGVVVLAVRRGSPAARLGLRPKDLIISVGGERVETVRHLEALLRYPRRVWQLGIRRRGQLFQLLVRG